MRVIGRRTLREGWERHPRCEQPLKAWLVEARRAVWHGFGDIEDRWRRARELPGDRVVFELGAGELRRASEDGEADEGRGAGEPGGASEPRAASEHSAPDEHRLVVAVRYDMGIAVVRFAGTRAEYEAIDPTRV